MADALRSILHWGMALGRTALGNTNFSLDQTTDQLEFIFQADEAATITRLGYRYGARTGTPPTYKISLQGVDTTTGNPDGTIKGGGSPASKTFTPPADASIDGLWQWQTLDNAYTCTAGEVLAIVIAYSSGTVNGSNFSSFTSVDAMQYDSGGVGLPYAIQNDAGVRTKSTGGPVFGFSSASKVYGQPRQSFYAPAVITQSTTPDEIATRFQLPARTTGSYQLLGIGLQITIPVAKTLKVVLYNGTTALQTLTWDTDIIQSGGSRFFQFTFQDATPATLIPGTPYRIGFQPQDAAGNYQLNGITQASNAEWAPYPLGIEWYVSTRTDAGAWTDDTTSRLECFLILKDLSAPAPGIIVAT